MFLGSAGFDVLSHGLKESLVRGTPINVTKFNLNISIAQLIAGFVLSPVLLAINKQCVNYPLPPLSNFKTAAFHEFYGDFHAIDSDRPEMRIWFHWLIE